MNRIHPKNWPKLKQADTDRVIACLDSRRFWRGDGTFALDLEERFAQWQGSRFALSVTNGTHALEVGLFAAGVSYGDEVLVPAFTFMSSASAVLLRNALPIPVDIDPTTFCLDPNAAEQLLTHRTRAIMPVHMSGHACDMRSIKAIADRHGLAIVEDCAHALGAVYRDPDSGNDARLGTIGTVGSYSFQASKVVSGGEGGMITTNSEEVFRRALSFCNYGWIPDGVPYDHFMVASNYRMPELTAALVIGQIDDVQHYSALRGQRISRLETLLGSFSEVRMQGYAPWTEHHGHFYFLIVLRERLGVERDAVVQRLVEAGFPARRAYPSFHKTRMFETIYSQCEHLGMREPRVDYGSFQTPVSDAIAEGGFWIPHWFFIEEDEGPELLANALTSIGVR